LWGMWREPAPEANPSLNFLIGSRRGANIRHTDICTLAIVYALRALGSKSCHPHQIIKYQGAV